MSEQNTCAPHCDEHRRDSAIAWTRVKEQSSIIDDLRAQLLAATERAKGLEKERDKWMNLECSDAVACPHKIHLEALTAHSDEAVKEAGGING